METWNRRVEESIRNQKRETELRYGIRVGQTEIYCSRCGRSWGYGKHTCQDIRFEVLRAKKGVKNDVTLSQAEFVA